MIIYSRPNFWWPVWLAFLLLVTPPARSQTVTNIIDQFNTNTYPNGTISNVWANWFGGAFQSLSLDPTNDANGNPLSGSLKIVANFPVNDQFTVWDGYSGISPALSGIQFTNFQCDIRFAAGSATTVIGGSNTFGMVQFGMGTPSWGQDYFINGNVTVSATNTNWVHVSIPLNVNTDTNLYAIANVFVHMWSGTALSGPSTLWVDNIKFTGPAVVSGTATVNYANTQQRIDGFGASSAWMSGTLPTNMADLFFSTNNGIGLSFLRTRIAPDGTTSEGDIAQQAMARGARIWSTPWSPPVIYKDTNTVNGGDFVSSVTNYQGYAAQLAGYVAMMTNTYGVPLFALSIQNEPDVSVDYESCIWTAQQFHDFMPYLAAAMVASNVAGTKILMPESEHWQFSQATNTMSDLTTSNMVGILAAHNYGTSATPVTQFGNPCPKTLWETEHYISGDDGITNAIALAQEIHSFMTVANANAYHYWWLEGDSGGGLTTNSYASPSTRLFAMGNYSRFIRPNFYRVGVTNNTTALVSAYKDSVTSNFTVVAVNPTPYPVNQNLVFTNFPVIGTLTQWVTSATMLLSNQGPVTVTNNIFNYQLPAMSVITFNFIAPVTNPPVIVQGPVSATGFIGESAQFTVTATGTAPLAYQWYFDGTNTLSGATNSALTLAGLTLANVGGYSVIITNYAGSVTSTLATLAVLTNATYQLSATDNSGSSSFNAIGNWTNTLTGAAATVAPTNGFTYATGPFALRTPVGSGNYTFGGDALTVSAGGNIYIKGGSGNWITFNNLLLNGTINDSINPNSIACITGNVAVAGGALNVSGASGDSRAITNGLVMSGSGPLTNYGFGYVVYTATNLGFTGPVVVTNTTLEVTSQANLGGNPATFNPAQLVLDNGTFQPLASFALNNPNSGVMFNPNGGTFLVPTGVSLVVSNPIAGPGNGWLVGGGLLALAGTNTATGNLVVSNGTLAALGNAIFHNYSVGVSNGATLDVTALAGPLTVSNKLVLAGNLAVAVNTAATNSHLAAGSIVYGGTLLVTNAGATLTNGASFQFFTATNYTGMFTSVTPAPGVNLAWNTNQLISNGRLTVVSALPPVITQQPVSQTVTAGSPATFTVTASGGTPLVYQWLFNGTNLAGATATNFTVASAAATNAGSYLVVVTNSYGSVTSIIVSLTLGTNVGPTLSVAANQPTIAISSNLFGAFFEELNFGGESGLYGELVRNRAFANSANPDFWNLVTTGSAVGVMAVDATRPLNTNLQQSLRLTMTGGTGSVGAGNNGFWGLPLKAGSNYLLSFYACGSNNFAGAVTARLQSNNGTTLYAQTNFTGLTTNWQKFSAQLTSSTTDTNAQLVVSIAQAGAVWLDVVSLFPQATYLGRTNGLRADLAGAVAALQPSFLRFPGGNYTEGDVLTNAFRWKTTVGDIATRPGHWNGAWGYLSTDGLGFEEYLQFCQDIGATPLFDINCGMALNYASNTNNVVATNQLSGWIQDALDTIQYANGATNTTWGAVRAANGHPAPFNLQYLEIGNENGGTNYASHYAMFYSAITNAYPGISLIASSWYDTATPYGVPTNVPVTYADEHHYASPSWFLQNATLYDSRSRSSPHVLVGEYAATSGYGTNGNLAAALGEAAFMTGLERNSDIVQMACYAPLFDNPNWVNWQPDALYFNNHQWFGTPSYYVQMMFSQNRGDVLLPVQSAYAPALETSAGAVGVGTWNTQAAFSNLVVTASNGVALYQSNFAGTGTNGWNLASGSWLVVNGALDQTNNGTPTQAWTGSTNWSNYTLTMQAQKLSGAEGFEIIFNYQDPNNYSYLNIGGWSNTSNAVMTVVGGTMKTVTSMPAPGAVVTGQWYNIQVTVNGGDAKCYLNGAQILDATNIGIPPVISSCSYAQRSGQIILKAVNPGNQAQTTQFNLASTNLLATNATVVVLTSPNASDENSFFSPNYVVPVTNLVAGVSTNFTQVLPPNSLSIFRFQVVGAGAAQIVNGPVPATVAWGTAGTFAVTATGTGPLIYQWSVDGTAAANGTNASFSTTNLISGVHAVSVTVTNAYGSATAATTLTIQTAPMPVFFSTRLAGTNLVFSGSNGGPSGNPFYTLYTTNLLLPMSNWTVLATNAFGPNGGFLFTNPWQSTVPRSYFRLLLP